ncbi:phosphoenolpyruvate--protein phosphotransferase [Amorphus orientalis]|uniref:Phosphoenolpyruvate-protein phosphotransferase n=1 Tax=Amorphus orientalis TaxID=649198 RepID=A0AAE4ARP4_9HYPH|nr:phosphoenolpyruvate--protein phosphotransferase [Amorphus orientalis]MDQ0315341.1 phosphotransferase system enzyme I (PtsI) [Amorphus orientalis]
MAEPLRRRDPAGPVRIGGTLASRGTAVGTLAVERTASEEAGAIGDEAHERARLAAAIERAKAELTALLADADDLAGEILGFQLALLDDPELIAPGEAALADGRGAAAAFSLGIGSLIDDYATADDEYFRARASDLRDLKARVLRALSNAVDPSQIAEGAIILVMDELTPSRFLELDFAHVRGIASRIGSPTSHVAMLARARGLPLLVGLDLTEDALDDLTDGSPAVLSVGSLDQLVIDPDAETLASARKAASDAAAEDAESRRLEGEPARTGDGTAITVLVNVDGLATIADADPDVCDGVGLTRTEFLFADGPADEDAQYETYRRIVEWADGRPVTIRTLDAGGDKPVPGITPDGETNPFLGLRGLRLSLAHPDLFRTQLRALLRAAAHGPVKIMLPMVTVPEELVQARALMDEAAESLAKAGVPTGDAPLGIMVETPAAALEAARFEAAEFYSIGTNDLIQYVTAAARDTASVAYLQDPLSPAVLRLIAEVATAGRTRGVEVSVCGEAASLPEVIPALLDCGIRTLSVPPAAVGRTKRAIAAHRLG